MSDAKKTAADNAADAPDLMTRMASLERALANEATERDALADMVGKSLEEMQAKVADLSGKFETALADMVAQVAKMPTLAGEAAKTAVDRLSAKASPSELETALSEELEAHPVIAGMKQTMFELEGLVAHLRKQARGF